MRKLVMILMAGFMSIGLSGCFDEEVSRSCFGTSTQCIGGYGYTCDNSSVCYSSFSNCQASSPCD